MNNGQTNSNKKVDKNSSNGLLTKVWGGPLWEALHCITFGYPMEPTEDDKKNYKSHFTTLQYVLPCIFCRESYATYISTEPTQLTDDVLKSRETLTKWLYLLHERVNGKLGVTYGVSYEDVCERYEAFRAKCDPNQHGCVMPLNEKAKSFEVATKKRYPIINYELASCFKEYAEKRGVQFNKLSNYNEISKTINCPEWEQRNKECGEIVSYMRINSVPAAEPDGEHKGLPTVQELLLISKLSSTLCKEDLYQIARKLGHAITRTYKLTRTLLDN